MAEWTNRDKAVVLDEICKELADVDWMNIWKSPVDDSWIIQIDGTIQVSAFAAEMIRDLMPGEDDG